MDTLEWLQRKSALARKKKESNGWLSTTLQKAEQRMERAEEKLDKSLEKFFRSNVSVPITENGSASFRSHRQSDSDMAQAHLESQSRRQMVGVVEPKPPVVQPHDLKPGLMGPVDGGRENRSVVSTTLESSSGDSLPTSSMTSSSLSLAAKARERLEKARKVLNHRLALLRKEEDQLKATDSPTVHSDTASTAGDDASMASEGADGLRSFLAEADRNFISRRQLLEDTEDWSVSSTGTSILRCDLAQADEEFLIQQEYEKRSVARTELLRTKQEYHYSKLKIQDLEGKSATSVVNQPILVENEKDCDEFLSALSKYASALASQPPSVTPSPKLESNEPPRSSLSNQRLLRESRYGALSKRYQEESNGYSVDLSFGQKLEERPVNSSGNPKSEVQLVDSSHKSEELSVESVSSQNFEEQSVDSSSSLSSHAPGNRAKAKPWHAMNHQFPPRVITLFGVNQNCIANLSSDDEDSSIDSTNTGESEPLFISSPPPLLAKKFLENACQPEVNSLKVHSHLRSRNWLLLILAVILFVSGGCYLALAPSSSTTAINRPLKLTKDFVIDSQKRRRLKRNTRMLVVDRRNNQNVRRMRSWTGIEPLDSKMKKLNQIEARRDPISVPKLSGSPDWAGRRVLRLSEVKLNWSFVAPGSHMSGNCHATGWEDLATKWQPGGCMS